MSLQYLRHLYSSLRRTVLTSQSWIMLNNSFQPKREMGFDEFMTKHDFVMIKNSN